MNDFYQLQNIFLLYLIYFIFYIATNSVKIYIEGEKSNFGDRKAGDRARSGPPRSVHTPLLKNPSERRSDTPMDFSIQSILESKPVKEDVFEGVVQEQQRKCNKNEQRDIKEYIAHAGKVLINKACIYCNYINCWFFCSNKFTKTHQQIHVVDASVMYLRRKVCLLNAH